MSNASLAWLRTWAIAIAAAGLLMALSALPGLDWPTRLFVDIADWPIDGSPGLASPEGRLLAVICGSVTAGWCTLIALLADRAGRTADAGPLRCAIISLAVWFVLDSLGSIAVGAWMNAVMNTMILAGFAVPMLAGGRAAIKPDAVGGPLTRA
jgi:hypothetical protein